MDQNAIYYVSVQENPEYPGSVTFTRADGRTWVCNHDGSLSSSEPGKHGQPETAQLTGNVAVFQPAAGVFWPFPALKVDKLV